MEYQVDVCREGILKSVSDQFTDKTTFLREMLQNCRRAGASRIDAHFDPHTLCLEIMDDGAGFDDFSAFFTIGKSGWDAQTQENENPFGIGAAAMFFAADAIEVLSSGLRLFFFTDDLLAYKRIRGEQANTHPGTRIRLWLKINHLRNDALNDAVYGAAKGFPVAIHFNGDLCPAPHAIGPDAIETAIGQVILPDIASPEIGVYIPTFYVQGQRVKVHHWGGYAITENCIVHLNSTAFRSRVPDRDCLVDESSVIGQVKVAVNGAIRDVLLQEKARLLEEGNPEAFSRIFWNTCGNTSNFDLLNDMPIPASIYAVYSEPVSLDEHGEFFSHRLPDRCPSMDNDYPAFVAIDYSGPESSGMAPAASILLSKLRLPILSHRDSSMLDDHWIRTRRLKLTDDIDEGDYTASVTVNGPTRSGRVKGFWMCDVDVKVCDSYTIRLVPAGVVEGFTAEMLNDIPEVTVTDTAIYCSEQDCILVPRGCHSVGYAVDQMSSFRDEYDTFVDSAREEDASRLQRIVDGLLHENPVSYLQSILDSADYDPTLLGDHSFNLRVEGERLVAA